MSVSPPIRRFSSTLSSSQREEDLINAYEAEEERIINILSRKLEQLREEKIILENTLEAESESHVNRLTRELSRLRLAHQQQQAQQQNGNGSEPGTSSGTSAVDRNVPPPIAIPDPSTEAMLEAMRRENEQLRNRLVEAERNYIRTSRLNEIYREELIEHRRRLGISVDNLIGLSSTDPFSQPTHHRSTSSSSSPTFSNITLPSSMHRPQNGMPIPRPPSQIHRPMNHSLTSSGAETPLSHSPSSTDSPFPFSPLTHAPSASLASTHTNITSPPSSGPFFNLAAPQPILPGRQLTYPSVPPPSLSSSFGSPNVTFHLPHRDVSLSPIEPLSRRNSMTTPNHRRASVERGARIAETGTLVPRSRSRAGSQSVTSAPLSIHPEDEPEGS